MKKNLCLLLLAPFLFVSCATPPADSSTVLSTPQPAALPIHGSVSMGVGTDPDYMRRSHVEL